MLTFWTVRRSIFSFLPIIVQVMPASSRRAITFTCSSRVVSSRLPGWQVPFSRMFAGWQGNGGTVGNGQGQGHRACYTMAKNPLPISVGLCYSARLTLVPEYNSYIYIWVSTVLRFQFPFLIKTVAYNSLDLMNNLTNSGAWRYQLLTTAGIGSKRHPRLRWRAAR